MAWFTRTSLFWKGLSWLEVLLVLATFVVLVAIIIPVRAGGGPTPMTACYSNVEQMAHAMIMYSADYDDRFPLRENWMESTYEYRKSDNMLRCPTFAWDEKAPKNHYGYAMNQTLSGAKTPPNPGTVPLVFDSVNLARNATGTLGSLPNPGRHNGKDMISYADGHAKAVYPNKP